MKKKISIMFGTAIFFMVLTTNLQHALDDYGLNDNSLHAEVLAQTNSSGTGSGSGSGSGSDGTGTTVGCYISTVLNCFTYPYTGQRKVCDYTGSYAPPYYCTYNICLDHNNLEQYKCTPNGSGVGTNL